jgi:hypothetical protein
MVFMGLQSASVLASTWPHAAAAKTLKYSFLKKKPIPLGIYNIPGACAGEIFFRPAIAILRGLAAKNGYFRARLNRKPLVLNERALFSVQRRQRRIGAVRRSAYTLASSGLLSERL